MASEIGVKSDLTFCFGSPIVKTNRAMELQVTHEVKLKGTVSRFFQIQICSLSRPSNNQWSGPSLDKIYLKDVGGYTCCLFYSSTSSSFSRLCLFPQGWPLCNLQGPGEVSLRSAHSEYFIYPPHVSHFRFITSPFTFTPPSQSLNLKRKIDYSLTSMAFSPSLAV